jgi:rhodanese-related sulfurtransferase
MTPTAITPEDLRNAIGTPSAPRLIDVRTAAEFESQHIAGSYNVPLDLLREHRDEIAGHLDDDVVLICRSGQRAGQAEEALRRAGLPNVHVLEGGIVGWERAGFDVKRGVQRWDLERQVRLVAGTIVAASLLVSLILPGAQWVAFAVGAGLVFAAVSNTCTMGMLLAKLPYNRSSSTCDAPTIVAQLAGPAKGRGGRR